MKCRPKLQCGRALQYSVKIWKTRHRISVDADNFYSVTEHTLLDAAAGGAVLQVASGSYAYKLAVNERNLVVWPAVKTKKAALAESLPLLS